MAKQTKKQAKPAISKVNRQITIGFIIVAIILVVIVGYFSISRANIYLIPEKYPVNATMELEILPEVKSTLQGSNILPGTITNFTKSVTESIIPSQTSKKVSKASGEVTIINNYTKNQPLIATTRLLDSNGLLFRLTKTVNVPAGGSVTVLAEADKEGIKYEIGPTKFIIPGLWEGLQDKIYAESKTKMSTVKKTNKIVAPADLEQARINLLNKIVTAVRKEYLKPNEYLIIKTKITSATSSVSVGDETESFEFAVSADVTTIQINKQNLEKLAVNNMKLETPNSQEYLSHNPDSLTYELIDYDNRLPSATIQVNISGIASAVIEEINKDDILGFSKEDAVKYFQKITGVKNVQVSLNPVWVKSIPPLKDHVKIEIVK